MTKASAADALPIPKPSGNYVIDGLLAALRESPWDRSIRLILADAVEESGSEHTASIIRVVQPNIKEVMQRIWPNSFSVHVQYSARVHRIEIHSKTNGFIMSERDFCDMVEGRSLLIDPEIQRAAEIERAIKVLRLFGS